MVIDAFTKVWRNLDALREYETGSTASGNGGQE
jgi:hypothetical protein